jgi:hypothetical protein
MGWFIIGFIFGRRAWVGTGYVLERQRKNGVIFYMAMEIP